MSVDQGVDGDWKQCALWLLRCGIIPKDHRVVTSQGQVQDLMHLLKEGVTLCNLLNRLRLNSVNPRDFSQRPQMSRFISTTNIKSFLHSCRTHFGMVNADLFDPMELFSFTAFDKVIRALSMLSRTPIALQSGISGFTISGKNGNTPKDLEDEEDGDYDYYYAPPSSAVDDEIYDTLIDRSRPVIVAAQDPKLMSHYDKVCKELIDTEKNYVGQVLDMLQKHFMGPLKKFFNPNDFETIFMYIEELLANHSEFLSNLEKTNSADSRCTISDCFIMCKEKFLVYGMFCGNLTHAQETLDKVMLNQTMMDHVSRCQMEANEGRFKLRDLLSVPMQRVLKYHLLLKELVKLSEYPERKSLERALEEMQDLSLFVNEVKRDHESLADIDLLQKSIFDLKLHEQTSLKDYGRMLHDGELKVKVENKAQCTRAIFLFDRGLLVCKLVKDEKYSYKDWISINQYTLEDRGTGFFLSNSERKWIFTFTSKKADVRTKWIEAIKMAQDNVSPMDSHTATHHFVMSSFHQPTICDVCRKLLRGIFYQGYKCKKTSLSVHKECLGRAKEMSGPPCLPPKPSPAPAAPAVVVVPRVFKVEAVRRYQGDPAPTNQRPPLFFEPGDVIEVLKDDRSSWYEGELNGKVGFFLKSSVKKVVAPRHVSAGYEHVEIEPLAYDEEDLPRHPSVLNLRAITLTRRPSSTSSTSSIPSTLYSPSTPSTPSPMARTPNPTTTPAPTVAGPEYINFTSSDELQQYQWFGGIMSREDATHQLFTLPNGTFVVRISVNDSRAGDYSLTLKYDNTLKHMKVFKDTKGPTLFYLGCANCFSTIPELVGYYQKNTLSRIFPEVQSVLLIPFKSATSAKQQTARMEPGVLGYCFAQYDYSARNPNEISMKQGDKIAVMSKDGDRRGWWKGRNYDKVGYFPNTYVKDFDN